MKPLLVVAGTRPEIIKLAPVLKRLRTPHTLCSTGQHPDLGPVALADVGLSPAVDLRISGDGPLALSTNIAAALGPLVRDHGAILVQGDTSSTLAGALAGALSSRPVIHLEAGLRSGNTAAPFPEEINRRTVAALATMHLSPNARAASALRREGVPDVNIRIVGNTGISALHDALGGQTPASGGYTLVTLHRREGIYTALDAALVGRRVVFVEHPNGLAPAPANAEIRPPLNYASFIHLLANADAVLTDSGGVQEEAVALGVPVVLMREHEEWGSVLPSGFEASTLRAALDTTKRAKPNWTEATSAMNAAIEIDGWLESAT